MNKRIKELEKQATIRVNNPIVHSDGTVICDDWEEGISISKFAELIVKECIQVAMHADNDDKEYAWFAIQRHFGVEE
jgi:hypothetical protein